MAINFIFVFTFVDYEASTYGDYLFPGWADAIGWIMAVVVISPIFITIFYKIWKEDDEDSIVGKLKTLMMPTREWGPYLVKHRKLIEDEDYVTGFVVDPYAEKRANEGSSQRHFTLSSLSINSTISRGTSKGSLSSIPRSHRNGTVKYGNGSVASQPSIKSI